MRALVAILLLAACAAKPPVPVVPPVSYRDASMPVASAALFDPGRFAGDWQVVARTPQVSNCDLRHVRFAASDGAELVVRQICADGQRRDGAATVIGPGRLALSPELGFGSAEQWVLWVDDGYRTAVLADPKGAVARILDRGPSIPADRLAAARIVLDFNGFDLEPLQEVTP